MAESDLIRIGVRGAGTTAHGLREDAEEVQAILEEEMEQLGDDAVDVLQRHAPRDSDSLAEGIVAEPFFRHARVEIDIQSTGAINEEDGFDYTAVSRFGHRRLTIFPVFQARLKLREGRGYPEMYRHSVSAVILPGDWVDQSQPEIEVEAERTMSRIGRKIDTVVLR